MRNLLAALTVSVCLASTAASAEQYMTSGVGTGTCGDFAESYRYDPNFAESIYVAWAQGFLTATNMARRSAGNDALPVFHADNGSQIYDGIWHAIRYHCNTYPLDDFINAVFYAGGLE